MMVVIIKSSIILKQDDIRFHHLITILLNVRTLSVVEVFCHLDYCSKSIGNIAMIK
jgi:hypothetical protein